MRNYISIYVISILIIFKPKKIQIVYELYIHKYIIKTLILVLVLDKDVYLFRLPK